MLETTGKRKTHALAFCNPPGNTRKKKAHATEIMQMHECTPTKES